MFSRLAESGNLPRTAFSGFAPSFLLSIVVVMETRVVFHMLDTLFVYLQERNRPTNGFSARLTSSWKINKLVS